MPYLTPGPAVSSSGGESVASTQTRARRPAADEGKVFLRRACEPPPPAASRNRPHGASAARVYWELGRAQALAAEQPPPEVSVPVGFTTFPGEIFQAPRSWVEQSYPKLIYFNKADEGGHFAAWEEPELFSEEIRAAFRRLR